MKNPGLLSSEFFFISTVLLSFVKINIHRVLFSEKSLVFFFSSSFHPGLSTLVTFEYFPEWSIAVLLSDSYDSENSLLTCS